MGYMQMKIDIILHPMHPDDIIQIYMNIQFISIVL